MMKNILRTLLALLALTAASCSNDDTGNITETRHNITFNISSSAPYDKFGVTDEVRDLFLTKNYNYRIGAISLIYDERGNLADSIHTYATTFQNLRQSFSLKAGKYTAVVIETLVNADYGYTSEEWNIENADKLSTLIIKKKDSSWCAWGALIGLTTKELTVSADANHSISPEALGAIVNVGWENFSATPYKFMLLERRQRPSGYYPNPTLPESDRYYYESYNETNVWSSIYSRYSETPLADNYFGVAAYVIDQGTITWCFGQAEDVDSDGGVHFAAYPTNGATATIKNGESYYAFCRYRSSDQGRDTFFGTYSDYEKWYAALDNQQGTLFREPYLVWGGTVAAVKSYMSGYKAYTDTPQFMGESGYCLWYDGKDRESEIDYYFTSATTGLNTAVVFFESSTVKLEEIRAFFNDSKTFTYMEYEDGIYYYGANDGTTMMGIFLNEDNDWVVIYVDTTSEASAVRAKSGGKSKLFPTAVRRNGAKAKHASGTPQQGRERVASVLNCCQTTMKAQAASRIAH